MENKTIKEETFISLKRASSSLALMTEKEKNLSLKSVIDSLLKQKDKILSENHKDVECARENGMTEALIERLELDDKKFTSMIDGINTVIHQTDSVGKTVAGWTLPNGMKINQVRVPLGVVAVIYESRPNVTADAFSLAYKSGNSILLRGSSSALYSNKEIVKAIQEGLQEVGGEKAKDAVFLCQSGERREVSEILCATGKIDVVLPRGSANLIRFVTENAKVPVIQTGAGVCHLYVDEDADLKMAANIALNAKTQRPGACNAIETILVHEKVIKDFLPLLASSFAEKVKIKSDSISFEILKSEGYKNLCPAKEEDFGFEFLDYTVSLKTVSSVREAIDFINSHGTGHSDAIITNNRKSSLMFQKEVDSACVYVNASTRFTDGGMFGFGSELGISTQKLHARGPMGAEALTTTKFLIEGEGQIR